MSWESLLDYVFIFIPATLGFKRVNFHDSTQKDKSKPASQSMQNKKLYNGKGYHFCSLKESRWKLRE